MRDERTYHCMPPWTTGLQKHWGVSFNVDGGGHSHTNTEEGGEGGHDHGGWWGGLEQSDRGVFSWLVYVCSVDGNTEKAVVRMYGSRSRSYPKAGEVNARSQR